jgi:hypothetical protein
MYGFQQDYTFPNIVKMPEWHSLSASCDVENTIFSVNLTLLGFYCILLISIYYEWESFC